MRSISTLGEFATATQLAECLGVSRSHIYQLCKRGKFPLGFRLGHNRRWAVSEVKEWLERQASQEGDPQTA